MSGNTHQPEPSAQRSSLDQIADVCSVFVIVYSMSMSVIAELAGAAWQLIGEYEKSSSSSLLGINAILFAIFTAMMFAWRLQRTRQEGRQERQDPPTSDTTP